MGRFGVCWLGRLKRLRRSRGVWGAKVGGSPVQRWRTVRGSILFSGCSVVAPSGPGMPARAFVSDEDACTDADCDGRAAWSGVAAESVAGGAAQSGVAADTARGRRGWVDRNREERTASSDPNAVGLSRSKGSKFGFARVESTSTIVATTDERRRSLQGAPDQTFSDFVSTGWLVFFLRDGWACMPDGVETGRLEPGSPVMPGIFPLR